MSSNLSVNEPFRRPSSPTNRKMKVPGGAPPVGRVGRTIVPEPSVVPGAHSFAYESGGTLNTCGGGTRCGASPAQSSGGGGGGTEGKVAGTSRSRSSKSSQLPEPVQSPLQPLNDHPLSAVAVSETRLPVGTSAVQL